MIQKSIWAKKENDKIHLLINHMLDVYHTANTLIQKNINIFSKLDSFSEGDKKIWAAVIGLHDIGKATPGFQNGGFNVRHELLSVYILFHYFKEKLNINVNDLWKSKYFHAIKFIVLHHSKFITIDYRDTVLAKHSPLHPIGDGKWKSIQFDILDNYLSSIDMMLEDITKISFYSISDAAYFAGLMTISDWIGSDTDNFKFEGNRYSVCDYVLISRKRAENAVKRTGLDIIPNIKTTNWNTIFPNIKKPRKLQCETIHCTLATDSNLIIVEAPTGEGKTEAAFNLAARLSKDKNSGIYIAMPTQASSNGLFNRFQDFLNNADISPSINLKIIHGSTFLTNLKNQISQMNINAPDSETESDAFTWFNHGKKAFLAPYGIGTVDQSLYSILIVKHFFLRLYSLTGKTVIFDEIHAYDAYMNELLYLLIKWLKALKANVILLSATLPIETKKSLIKAWDNTLNVPKSKLYPVLEVINENSVNTYSFDVRYINSNNNNFNIDFCKYEEEEISKIAEQHYCNGARVLVIVNKVKRAQQIFHKININDKTLIHSRFIYRDRERIEKEVLNKYGKVSPDTPSILVSTQIVEQSLDIDFDIVITDLAPIDLLIQRAGRLHRHDRQRPKGYSNPKFIIATHDAHGTELPKLNDANIYTPIILYRTYFALKKNSSKWNFHRDFREPIEEVYYKVDEASETLLNSDLSIEAKDEIRKSIFHFNQETLRAENEAKNVLIYSPEEFDKILSYNEITHIEDEENGRGIIAKTRLGSDQEKVILLFENDGKYFFDLSCTDELNINNPINDSITTYKLLINLISLSSYQALKYATNEPEWWNRIKKQNKILKHYNVFIINNASTPQYDEIYGLTFKE